MATIQSYCAKEVFDPPTYSQAVKVTGAQTILFLSGQVAYDEKGTRRTGGISPLRPAPFSGRSGHRWSPGSVPWRAW
jgi:enamine deaminase RidA (YjgF/YER057c/UK114 family)